MKQKLQMIIKTAKQQNPISPFKTEETGNYDLDQCIPTQLNQ